MNEKPASPIDQSSPWRQYICRACGLIYDEKEGDPDSGLAPGTRFEDIPDDWECPLCGVRKTDFELFERQVITAVPQTAGLSKKPGIVIVGAGLAGWSVVEHIRELDSKIPITLVSACAADRYHKPELSVALSRGMKAEKLIKETAAESSQRLGVKLLNHSYVVGISPAVNQLRTTRGTVKYTKLVLAQGARSVVPPELPKEQSWRINDLSSWTGLEQVLRAGPQHVAIVGAGMIGCEVAEDLAKAGHHVTLLDRGDYPLATMLPEIAGQHLTDNLTRLGVDYKPKSDVAMVTSDSKGQHLIQLKDESEIPCDQLLVAAGLATDKRLPNKAELTFDRGIAVDPETLQTSDKDIYALGDCISLDGEPCRFIEPIRHQARTIAKNVLGLNSERYEHRLPVVRLKTTTMPVELIGRPNTDGQWQTLCHNEEELVMEQRLNDKVLAKLKLDLSVRNKAA